MYGQRQRAIASTKLNSRSTRSHTIFTIMHKRTNEDGSQVLGRLNLVDLAGSERIAKTEAKGQQLREATCINQSLTCLGSCIKSLILGHNHIPYRDSKLTFILRDALNGENSKTTLICTVSKEIFHLEESVQTLEFAQRARNVKTIIF